MLVKIARWLLPWCIKTLYSSKESKKELVRMVNNETWVSAQISSGGHALRDLKPIGYEEAVSIFCVFADRKSHVGNGAKFREIDYFNSEWTG